MGDWIVLVGAMLVSALVSLLFYVMFNEWLSKGNRRPWAIGVGILLSGATLLIDGYTVHGVTLLVISLSFVRFKN